MNPPVSSLLSDKGSSVYSVPVTATVADAVAVMNEHKVGSVVVLEDGNLVGIFTERDVLYRVVAEGLDPAETPLEKVMTRNPKIISPDATVQDALEFISENRCRHLPVVADGKLLGLISQGDITRWFVEAHKSHAEQLMTYITGGMG
ncbi:MAG: CBS domain-containing protein [Verrucomicrobia bacterium]|nr:MAG: CBS domain-containing protein [Verrucomicrobiota bacterium]